MWCLLSLPAYPEYMKIKQGTVILTEADWPTVFGRKYGLFLVGAGSVVRDTDHIFGGTGSASLVTDANALDLTELKVNLPNVLPTPKIVAFEHKFITDPQFGANHYFFGLEDRLSVSPFFRGEFRYTVTGDVIEYESAEGVFTALPDGGAVVDRSSLSGINGSGDMWTWVRAVVDFEKNEYVSLEFESALGGYKKIDMTGIALPSITSGNTTTQILVFAIGETPTTTITTYYTTDWVISKVPF